MLQVGKVLVRFLMKSFDFSIDLILDGVKGGWCIKLTTSLPSVSELSRKCESLEISQPYWPPQPATETALLSFLNLFTVKDECE
jgi:hypothetical protein